MKKLICLLVVLILSTTAYASDITVTVDGTPVVFEDVKPVIVDERTLVPLRGVFEKLGFGIDWDEDDSLASIYKDDILILAWTDRRGLMIAAGDRFSIHPEQPVIDGRFMLPVRLIAEASGARVEWDEDTRTVSISTRPINTMRTHTDADIVSSERGYYFVRNEIIVIAAIGQSFDQIDKIMSELGGKIVGFLEVPNTYQVYFQDTPEAELLDLADRLNAHPLIIHASKNLVMGIPQRPYYEPVPADFEVRVGHDIGWIIGDSFNLSPEVVVLRSTGDVQEFLQEEGQLDEFDEDFFETHILILIAHTELSTAPITIVNNVTTDGDTLVIEMLTTFPHGGIGGQMLVPVSYTIAVDRSLDRENIRLSWQVEDWDD